MGLDLQRSLPQLFSNSVIFFLQVSKYLYKLRYKDEILLAYDRKLFFASGKYVRKMKNSHPADSIIQKLPNQQSLANQNLTCWLRVSGSIPLLPVGCFVFGDEAFRNLRFFVVSKKALLF